MCLISTISKGWLLSFSAAGILTAALGAAGATWQEKPVAQWTEQDAKQVIANSAWVKWSPMHVAPHVSEAERRESGGMGGAGGVGLQGLDPRGLFLGISKTGSGVTKGSTRKSANHQGMLEIRWESATPMHAAELKLDEDAPDWKGEYYAIAVYGVPIPADELLDHSQIDIKKFAFLKRVGKKDLKPARVEIIAQTDTLSTVVYLFPRSPSKDKVITADDEHLEFDARVGRILLTQIFDTAAMRFHDRLEL